MTDTAQVSYIYTLCDPATGEVFGVSPATITGVKQGRGCYQKVREQWVSFAL